MKLIPDSLQTQPVFLCVDDTMVSKFDTKFENVSKLFQNLDLIGNARIDSVMYDPNRHAMLGKVKWTDKGMNIIY